MNIEALYKISYGLYIISSLNSEKLNGYIATTAFQVTANSPQIAIASHKDNYTTGCIIESNVFAVSVLQQDVKMEFISHFGFQSGKKINKFHDIGFRTGQTGAPIVLENTIAFAECKVRQMMDVGTHFLFIGEVVDSEIFNNNLPLTYDYYRSVIKGVSPSKAPTYTEIFHKPATEEKLIKPNMSRYKCSACNYTYDPLEGDPDSLIPPGTPFEEIPDDWRCPVCKVDKSYFEKID